MSAVTDWVRARLQEPRMAGVDVESPRLIDVHQSILGEKQLMQRVFREFYEACIDARDRYFNVAGVEIEIGASISLFKRYYPHVTVTDVKASPWVDRALDAQNMDLAAETVRAIYGINCFHHFPEPRRFLRELLRVLKPGGGCVLIEPYYSPFSNVLYPRLHGHERFDREQAQWEAASGAMGYLRGANQALSYIVFVRDRDRLQAEFPQLEIVEARPLDNYVAYLLSGGLNFRQLVPRALAPGVKSLERLLRPALRLLALHHLIVIRKRPPGSGG